MTIAASTTESTSLTTGTATATPVLSILSLISGISGIVFGLVIPLSIIAIVLGILAFPRETGSRTMATWGIVLGAVPGALIVLGLVLAAAFIVPFGAFALAFGL